MDTDCSKCGTPFDVGEHIPEVLRCQHTFCKSCVKAAVAGSVVVCPAAGCYTHTSPRDVIPNTSVTDRVRLCEDCAKNDKFNECKHCDKKICNPCAEKHTALYHGQVIGRLQSLDASLKIASQVYDDLITKHATEESDTIQGIKGATQAQVDALRKHEMELIERVKDMSRENVQRLAQWKTGIDNIITPAEQFTLQAINQLGPVYQNSSTMEGMGSLDDQCRRTMDDLSNLLGGQPATLRYRFQKNQQNDIDVGSVRTVDDKNVISQSMNSTVPLPGVPSQTNTNSTTSRHGYTHASFISVAGVHGTEECHFNVPCAVACMRDRIFVTDTLNHRVKVYSHDLELLFTFGGKGSRAGQFQSPAGVAVAVGEVYVSDSENDRICVFTKTGKLVGTVNINRKDRPRSPYGIATNDREELFICDRGNKRVQVVRTDGSHVRTIGSGLFEQPPMHVAVTYDDRLIVKELGMRHLHVFSTGGEYKGTFPKDLSVLGQFLANGIAVDVRNNVFVADAHHRVVAFNTDGDFLFTFGSHGSLAGQFDAALNVAVHWDKYIYVCDWGNHRIQKFELE